MLEFFHDLLNFPFLFNAVLASALIAVAAGSVGSLVVVRRSTYLAGAVSHSVLAGLGLARFLQRGLGFSGLSPMGGAILVAIGVAVILTYLTRQDKHRSDTVLSAIWTGGTALGVSFISATPGYQDDLMSYLFGSILLITQTDLLWMVLMDGAIVATILICYNRFLAIAFNEELARLRGVPTLRYELIYHVLTALTVVLLVRMTGIVLAIALLTLPAATAGKLVTRLDAMMLLGVVLSFGVSVLGLAISYTPGWPPGATIVEVALILYGLSASITFLKRRTRGSV